ncbi:peptidoglycan DD-metalloendopeptidase family protein [Salinisphaera sp. Q1T1-3]|uniref:peptidoglycan DD-metalloendopeptidase family protein n=1 Tax=Salinisphaera sp. Q1T1-3 TaxID=2321229 RepID=UPI000E756868|nr:peptidoglycan DD-metalloendopeptidase family protein [Salinisphaera sp. Q1T1-3]RJS91574.1 peptidase M23 [Salinisphaera sp. Q1T1-3]
MGRLVDQDYLWLRESPAVRPAPAWRRWLPFGLVPVAAVGVWYAFYTNPDMHTPDDALAATPPMPSRLPPAMQGHLIPAVARPDTLAGMRLTPVSRFDRWDSVVAPGRQRIEDNALADALAMAPAASLATDDKPGWRTLTIRRGDTLSLAFQRYGLSYMDSLRIAHLPKLGHFFTSGLKPGRLLRVKADRNGRVAEVHYVVDAGRTITLTRQGDGFTADLAEQALDHRRSYASGVIRHSFYKDARAAGLSAPQIAQVQKALAHDVDFGHDLKRGDRFVVAYDELYRDGRRVGTGPILGASLTSGNHAVQAVRYTDSAGHTDYYRPDGRPLRPAFVRAPVAYTRISSPFNMSRRHPILHRIRRHEGTDYAAPEGAPIHATGAGKIVFRGRRGGYGNVVIIRHDARVTMRFAHMARFARGLSVGDTVAEGDVIGYVGMTGLATGPHVHYEFRINGKPYNPQTVTLPGAAPLSGRALARFKQASAPLVAQLDDAGHRPVQLADASATESR